MSEQGKKLYRSNSDRWLAGVCGGLGEYLGIDATVVRVLFILFSFAVGGGLLIYLILWLIIPNAPVDGETPAEKSPEADQDVTF